MWVSLPKDGHIFMVDVISTMLIIYNDAVGKQVLKSVAFCNGNHDRC